MVLIKDAKLLGNESIMTGERAEGVAKPFQRCELIAFKRMVLPAKGVRGEQTKRKAEGVF